MQKELEASLARLSTQTARAEKAEGKSKQLQKELGAAIGLSLSPSPRDGRGRHRRACTPPHSRSIISLPQFGLPVYALSPKGEADAMLGSPLGPVNTGLAAESCETGCNSIVATAATPDPVEAMQSKPMVVQSKLDHNRTEPVLQYTELMATDVAPDPTEANKLVAEEIGEVNLWTCRGDLAERNGKAQAETRADKVLEEKLEKRELELQKLQQVHRRRQLQLRRCRRGALVQRRLAQKSTAQLRAVRRKMTGEAARLQAEWEDLLAWREELLAWWQQKQSAHKDGTLSAVPDHPEYDITPPPTLSGKTLRECGLCEADGDAEAMATLPNCTKDSRRIARGKSSPSRLRSFLKNLKPKKVVA